jgi:poly(3-hydroxybutyrate) depolymerase
MKNLFFLFSTLSLIYCSSGKDTISGSNTISENKNIVKGIIQSFEIKQTWSQNPDGYQRSVFFKYPENDNNNIPILILLHGNGGNAKEIINEYDHIDNHLIVSPQGYKKSWNIGRETSKAPDVEFINEVIERLKTFKNIDIQDISIIGYSNGSALVNQLLIELKTESFKKAICLFSQLNKLQYRDNEFWSRSNINSDIHDIKTIPQNFRKILSFSGTKDTTCPYYGGLGVFDYDFINSEEVAFIWAKTMGYNSDRIKDPEQIFDNFFKFSYLNDRVIHYRLEGARHGLDPRFEKVKNLVKAFIEN